MESVTVHCLRYLRSLGYNLFLTTASLGISATFASGSVSVPHLTSVPHSQAMNETFANRIALVPQIAPLFPAVGLLAAAWATQHVRRRNARQLAATK
jgi:hypothetical protein